MDVARIKLEMRLLAEARITRFVGEEEILLTKSAAARIFNKSLPWVDLMIATGRLPTIRAGPKDKEWIQRPVLVEGLVNGL
jgi:hypothetical protein